MNPLDQYTDLYRSQRDTIDAHAPEVFNALRPAAFEALRRFGRLPRKGEEGYEKISVDTMFAPDYGLNVARVPFAVDVAASFRCDVPNISTLLGVVVNDSFRPTATLERNLPEGLEVMSLARAAEVHPELVASYLNRLAANSTPQSALNTLLLQDGVFIRAARGVRPEKAVQIVNIFNSASPLMAVRRVLIVAEEDSALRVLFCDHSQSRDISYLSSQVVEVFAGEGATVELYDIEESSASTSRMSEVYLRQEAGSDVRVNSTSLYSGQTRNSYSIDIVGDRAHTDLSGIVIGSEEQTIDNAVELRHHSCRSTSRQLFKYALFDKAQGAFGGKIIVDEGAMFTDASQNNRNLIASADARMHTEPQLEIYCDEVKCSHGATTGQLDAAALFYMRTRGIPEAEARMMLVQAFMVDVINGISLDALRDRMRMLVEKRLCGTSATCSSCSASACRQDQETFPHE